MNSTEDPSFDHLLHLVPDAPAAAERYTAAGMTAHVGPPSNGFQNGGWRLDERYIEILSITDEEAVHRSSFAGGVELLKPAIQAMPDLRGAITFAVHVNDARGTARRLQSQGYCTQEFTMTFEGTGISFVETFVVDPLLPWMPFFVTYHPPRHELLESIDLSLYDKGRFDIESIEVTTQDIRSTIFALSEVLGVPAHGHSIPLPGARVDIIEGEAETITAIAVSGNANPSTTIDGLAFRF